jgi:hypothetical protein
MVSIPVDSLDRMTVQLAVLNLQLCVFLCCKGLNWAARQVFRRDPPTKANRSKLAQSDGS